MACCGFSLRSVIYNSCFEMLRSEPLLIYFLYFLIFMNFTSKLLLLLLLLLLLTYLGFTLSQATKALRESRGIALLYFRILHYKGWGVSVTTRPHFTHGKDPVPILQEAGWASGPVWTGAENLAPHRDLIPGPSSPLAVALPATLPGPLLTYLLTANNCVVTLWQ